MWPVFDPAAMQRSQELLPPGPNLRYVDDSYAAAENADAAVILTDWAEFKQIDLHRLNQNLRYPIVIDGRNLFDPAHMSANGFTYISGRSRHRLPRASRSRSAMNSSSAIS